MTPDQHRSVLEALKAIQEIDALCLGGKEFNTSAIMVQTRRGAIALYPLIRDSGTVYPEQKKIPA